MKRISFSALTFAVLVAALFTAGCATNSSLEKLQADMNVRLAVKADKADVAKIAGDAARGFAALGARVDKTEATVADLRNKQVAIDSRVVELAKAVDAVGGKLAAIKKNVIGVRKLAAGVVGRLGTLEDSQGFDHYRRVLRLPGFPTARLDKDGKTLAACAEISKTMQARVAEVKAFLGKGWKVVEIAGFADNRPFRKNGKVLENSDNFNTACATNRAEAVAEALGVNASVATGRGATTKLGEYDVNRSVLVYLERDTAPAAAPAKP